MKRWVFILLLFPFAVHTADFSAPEKMAAEFFDSVVSGSVNKAYDTLFTGSSIPQSKPQAVTFLIQQTNTALPMYGKVLGYELIHKEQFGESLVRLVYLLKSDLHPTVWEFYFYNPSGKWFLSNINFNDQFSSLDRKTPYAR